MLIIIIKNNKRKIHRQPQKEMWGLGQKIHNLPGNLDFQYLLLYARNQQINVHMVNVVFLLHVRHILTYMLANRLST